VSRSISDRERLTMIDDGHHAQVTIDIDVEFELCNDVNSWEVFCLDIVDRTVNM
jgi:hypothetical protein